MFHTKVKVCQYYPYGSLRTAMDRHTEAVDVYSVLNPIFFVPKVLGLLPYNVVGDVGNRRFIVSLSAVIYSIGMLMLHVGVFSFCILTDTLTWKNICSSGESIIVIETMCLALCAYCTSLFGCRQTARHITRLNDLIGKTYYSAWKTDLQLLLAIQILCVIITVIGAVLEMSLVISEVQMSFEMLVFMLYYVAELSGFMSEQQFVALMHVLKRTVQNWNGYIDYVCENDEVFNSPLYRDKMSGHKSVLFIVSHTSVTSKRERMHSTLMQIKQLREHHASACDIAESVNAVYSPMLLISVAKLFTSITNAVYYVVVTFIMHKANFFCEYTGNSAYFIWLILYILRLIWMVHFTVFAAKEVSHNVKYFNFLHNYRPTNEKLVSALSVFLVSSVKSFLFFTYSKQSKQIYFANCCMLHISLAVMPYTRSIFSQFYIHLKTV